MEISFYIPNANTQFVGDENRPPAQVFREKIMSVADVGTGVEEAVVTFEGIAILTPRGRYSVKLHLSFLRLQGQANDFKIQYSSVVRLFLLPKLIHILNALRTKLVWMKVMMSCKCKMRTLLLTRTTKVLQTDDSGEKESDASESGNEKEKPAKKDQRKEAAVAAASSSSKESKKKGRDGQDDGKKKKRKMKNPNAPKRAMTGFFYFSQAEREAGLIYIHTHL
ncbi:FACT complex subunit SSRP1 isoform X1 [Gossypium hirsutum]|uniref:FACT complex subunit SSRP1 n=1 Tax=Gossypium hirsutum TaxID=3635 RepID=A0ABM2YLW6_GOSHI|nr:FACT complex subunit SSRP1-like isoform X1 [Gossypium hirsutum]